MYMYERLSADEREQLLSILTVEQRDILENELKRGRKTVFENFMRDEKITAIKLADEIKLEEDEMNVVDWRISDYVDFGPGNLHGLCACNRRLRYMFTVEHQITGKKIQYGKDHLSTFLNIEVKDIDGFVNELDDIDHELDELLWKVKEDQYFHEYYERLPDKTVVSKDIIMHIEVKVPLLDRQINRLNRQFEKQMEALIEEQNKIQREIEFERQQEVKKRMEALLSDKKRLQSELEEKKAAVLKSESIRKQMESNREESLAQERLEKNAEVVAATKALLGFSATLEDIVYALVLNGQHSAVAISFNLIEDFGFDKRMSVSIMNRPRIYADVLNALMKHVEIGNLIRDESSSMKDCIFYVNPYPEEVTNITNQEDQQQQALTLF